MKQLIAGFALLFALPALGQTPAPDALVNKMSEEVIAAVRQDGAET